MDDSADLPVKQGLYYSNVANCWMWLLPNNTAGIAVQFLGIWLTLAFPRIWVAVLTLHRRGTSLTRQNGDRTGEAIPDPGEYALDRIWGAGLPRNRLPTEALPRRDTRMALRDAITAFGGATVFVLVIVLGTLTSLLSGDSTAILQSENCGYWKVNLYAPRDLKLATMNRGGQRENTVLAYARDCYGGRGAAIEGCSLFIQQDLPYTVTEKVACPFGGEMCILSGDDAAISFTTPPLQAQNLGLNADKSLEFMRTTTCTPLVRNESFLITDYSLWHYQYGKANLGSGYTFDYPVRNFTVLESTYTIKSTSERGTDFLPVKDLQVSNDSILTLMFIDVSRIIFLAEGFDPVFYAHDLAGTSYSGEDEWWMSLRDQRDMAPRVLACIDGFNMRNAHTNGQWHNSLTAPQSSTSTDIKEWTLLYKILQQSTAYEVTSMAGSSALNASSRIAPGISLSLPLTSHQWKIEAQHWFEASLANAQFEVRRIGLGLDSTDPCWYKDSDGDGICDYLFLANAAGYTNVYFVPWLVIFLVSLFVIITTFPIGPREKRRLVFEYLPSRILDLIARCCVSITSALGSLLSFVIDWSRLFIMYCSALFRQLWAATSRINPWFYTWIKSLPASCSATFRRYTPRWFAGSKQNNGSGQAVNVQL